MGSPDKIGDIRPIAEMHRGATTTVFKGYQESLDRFVLLKILHPQYSDDEKIAARFEDEARLAAKIQHPNVVSVHAFGREGGRTYIAAEFVEGQTLQEVIAKGPVPPGLAAYVLVESANALKAAHEKGILHRDIKPSNILISTEGRVKVADFGMASVFGSPQKGKSEVRGTLAYLAPEQILGTEIGKPSDLFSLGATFFEMLLGMPAFKGATSNELIENVLNFDPVSSLHDDDTIPSQLRRICQQLIKKKGEQRYRDCNVLLADLHAYQKSRGQGAIATAIDMKNYLADPETYVRKLRDKPVSLRTREPRPERKHRDVIEVKADQNAKKPAADFNRSRLFAIAAVLVLVFGGLSFAGGFIFSKDGSFGARSNPNGSPGASSPTSGAAISRKGRGSASGTPVQSNDGSQTPGSETPLPQNEPPRVVSVEDEDPETYSINTDSSANPRASDGAVPDTVILIADPERPNGRMIIDATPWAAVFLEGDSLGVTPLPLVVPPGTYAITLINPEFPPYETLVDVVPGRETPFKVSLWLLVGTVQVEVFPFAEVSIDGAYRDENSSG